MLTLLSPAKKLTKYCVAQTQSKNEPQFLEQSKFLAHLLKKMSPDMLCSLMGISQKLAVINWERMQAWDSKFDSNNSRESIYTFLGDTYNGLDAETLTDMEIQFAQNNIRILSGLYGILRPLDLIKPYRLEMSTNLKNTIGKNLYEFWNDRIVNSIKMDLKTHQEKIIINCASVEYFKAVNRPSLNTEVITPQFKDYKNGNLKIISFYAKKARGMMARFIIKNRIDKVEDILSFNLGGYTYDASLSSKQTPVFTRTQA